jgi:uncharacterized membrane protein
MALQHTINGVKRRRKQRRKEMIENALIIIGGLIIGLGILALFGWIAEGKDWD